jgi:hypothetical protein
MKLAVKCRDVLVMALTSEDQPLPALAYRGGNRIRKLAPHRKTLEIENSHREENV